MKVLNKEARLLILGDEKRTRLMPGRVTECSDKESKHFSLCVERAITKGRKLEIVDAPVKVKAAKADSGPEPKKFDFAKSE